MAAERLPELVDVIAALKKPEAMCHVTWEEVQVYDIAPREFLSFAREDLQEDSDRARVNALANAKRALECRVDEILTLANFRPFAKKDRWGLPYKLQVVKTFGLSAPDVLQRRVGRRRNLLEHDYARPKDADEIRDVVDIVELFLKASDQYVSNGHIASTSVWYTETAGEWKRTRRIPSVFRHTETSGERDRTERIETRVASVVEYELAFDLSNEEIRIECSTHEEVQWHNLSTGGFATQRKTGGEASVSTVPIGHCRQEELRELMRLLRDKGRVWAVL